MTLFLGKVERVVKRTETQSVEVEADTSDQARQRLLALSEGREWLPGKETSGKTKVVSIEELAGGDEEVDGT